MINDNEILSKAMFLVNSQSTMTIATSGNNRAWAAPVYFTFYKTSFFFFSDPQTRHISEAIQSGQAAAAIYSHAATSWQEICGIQMSGCIRQVQPGFAGIKAIKSYIKKFPFTQEFLETGEAPDLASFNKRFRVKLYRFDPDIVFYLDNQIKFGFRTEIRL